jgi:hypothetical protein
MKMKLFCVLIVSTFIFSFNVFAQQAPSAEQYTAYLPLGEIARNAIPPDKPGRLRAYFLPSDQTQEQAIHDLKEALALEKGRTGYFALLSENSSALKELAVEALAEVAPTGFCKLTIIFVGNKLDGESISKALAHTGAQFILKEH